MTNKLDLIRERASAKNALHGCSSDPCGSVVCQTARDRDALLSRLEQAEQRVALLESGIVAGIVNTSVFTARAIGAEVSSVSESILNMGYPALREQLEQAERLLERVRSEAQELADMNEPAGENFLSILDGEQDG